MLQVTPKVDSFLSKLRIASLKFSSFSQEDVKSEIGTIAVGASETTGATSCTFLILLALYPNIQERLFQEIYSAMPDKNSSLTYNDLNELKFLDQCLNETLRLYPSVPIVPRHSDKPFVLKNGIVIPPKVPLIISLRHILRQEKYWGPNANLFDPTRFEKEKLKNYIPFGCGPRDCVGKKN